MEKVAQFVLLCLSTAGLMMFLEECQKQNMILRRYRLWLVLNYIRNWRKKDRWKRFYLKPIGLCIYCTGAWVSIIVYNYFYKLDLILLSLYIGLTFLFIKNLHK